MSIDWEKIQTNVISAIIIAIVAGAGAIVWKGATTVDNKVDNATMALRETTDQLQDQANYMTGIVEIVQQEVFILREQNHKLVRAINTLIKEKYPEAGKEYMLLEIEEMPEENYIQQKLPELKK
jgi:hypothetical protein